MLSYNARTSCLEIFGGDSIFALRKGGSLPHASKRGAVYSVCFRLADSLPRAVVESWVRERENIVATARQLGRELSSAENRRLDFLHREQVDRFLDAGRGACWLKQDSIANLVADALAFFDGVRYDLICWAIVPNHVHAVLHPRSGYELDGIMHSWKSFTAKKANILTGHSGQFWTHESYDHVIRDSADLWHSVKYTLANPGKAGLKNWQWTGTKVEADFEGVRVLKEERVLFEGEQFWQKRM